MKIKMYTKAMCFPFKGTPYEKTMCVVYDSIDDINMVDGEDISKIAPVNDSEVSYHFGDTDGDMPLRPCLTQCVTPAKMRKLFVHTNRTLLFRR